MSDLSVFDRGTATVVGLDTGTDVIATLAGFDPAWSNEDVIAVEPGESARRSSSTCCHPAPATI